MKKEQRLRAFVELGNWIRAALNGKLEDSVQRRFEGAIELSYHENGWFTGENTRHALGSIADMLRADTLEQWAAKYPIEEDGPAYTVGTILAGNIPMVGFHDLLCVLVSGHKVVAKSSHKDKRMLPLLAEQLITIDPAFVDRIRFVEKLENYDAVIATGSGNSARYFNRYFGDVPHIIRKNRYGVAVLDGTEEKDELEAFGEDIFRYFGLGCRNVAKMFIPRDFDLDRFFEGIYAHHPVIQHNKYANNYDYHKAIWLLNEDEMLDNGFLLLREDENIGSPVGSLFYERYDSEEELENRLIDMAESIQCAVGHGGIPFGQAQKPAIDDYADNVDTMEFLSELKKTKNFSG